jgi:hypothetical protein
MKGKTRNVRSSSVGNEERSVQDRGLPVHRVETLRLGSAVWTVNVTIMNLAHLPDFPEYGNCLSC